MKQGNRWLGLAWSAALVSSATAGVFLGAGNFAHTDIAKYSAILAQHERAPAEVVLKLSDAGTFARRTMSIEKIFGNNFHIAAINAFETNNKFYKVKLESDTETAAFLEALNKNPAIAYAEPNYIYRINGTRDAEEVIPNNPDLGLLWGMKNIGQKDAEGTVGVAGADINATKAWAKTTGSKDIVVAVIDTGVDYNHEKLADNIFQNKAECDAGTDGIDNDGNGFVDDCRGWNFAGVSNNDPMDDNAHGTHVSGTIGAKGNDGKSIVGVNWNVSILPIKFLTGSGSGTLEDAVKSIQYATIMGANMSSNSWGGGGFTQSMYDSIVEAKNKGILFIAAAGNDSENADSSPHYPAGYQVDNVIAVAASTNRDTLADFSTYGKRTVHIAAPGHKILSSVPGNRYDTYSGTSMATPHVSGAAALLWSTDKNMKYNEVKERLLKSRDFVPNMARKIAFSGRLNVYNAVMGIYPPSPEPAESDWRDVKIDAPIESAHPYKDNAKQEWTIEGPANAKYIRVHFAKAELESNYDFVRLFDSKGVEVDAITGEGISASASYYGEGNMLKIVFTSDSSETRWGFMIDKIQVVY